jgi:hypothetical protein
VSTNPSLSFAQLASRVVDREEVAVKYVGLDVHREFCEVAIAEEGRVRSAGRIRTRRGELELFAQSLGSDDEVALESTGGAVAIARILEPRVARVVVVNTKKLRQISEAKAKTDRLDARRLAELLAAGYLAEVRVCRRARGCRGGRHHTVGKHGGHVGGCHHRVASRRRPHAVAAAADS